MNQGCSGDKNPSDGDKLPERDRSGEGRSVGKGKGKARARTPPPVSPDRLLAPPGLPERVSDEHGEGRNPARVALEAFERGVGIRAMAAAAVPVAPDTPVNVVAPMERRKTRSITRKNSFASFVGMPNEFFSSVFEFVPFSHFLMFLCTSKFLLNVFPPKAVEGDNRKSLWKVAFDCFKLSFSFVRDFGPIRGRLDRCVSDWECMEFLRTVYREYFGDGLLHVVDSTQFPGRVRFNDFFNGDPLLSIKHNTLKMSGFLCDWINISFIRYPHSVRNYFNWRSVFVPLGRFSTLRHSGIFSTARTRQALIKCLRRSMKQDKGQPYKRFHIMLSFLIRLTSESFVFNVMSVDSGEFRDSGKLTMVPYRPNRGLVIDVSEEDFQRLHAEFIELYGNDFMGMVFYLPPPSRFPQ